MKLLDFLFGKNIRCVEKDEAAEILSRAKARVNKMSSFSIPDKLEPIIEEPIKPELHSSVTDPQD